MMKNKPLYKDDYTLVKKIALVTGVALSTFTCGVVLLGRYYAPPVMENKSCHNSAMTLYEPVRNGGALAEFYGKVSPEREEMYRNIEEVRETCREHYNY